MNIALLTTTGGSLINETLKWPRFRSRIRAVISDRRCGALGWADKHGVETHIIAERDNPAFSDELLAYGQRMKIDYFITSSFTRLLAGRLVEAYEGRLFNTHPSLLPAFIGLYPIDKNLKADTRFLGNTIHMIDETVDGGAIVLQSVVPRDYDLDDDQLRHKVFEQVCQGLIQLVSWLWDGRLKTTDQGVRIEGAQFDDPKFSPSLDDEEALGLSLPHPWWEQAVYAELAARMGRLTQRLSA